VPLAILSWWVLPGSGTLAAAGLVVGGGAVALAAYVVIARALGFGIPAELAGMLGGAVSRRLGRRGVPA
jgi:hypothetical protein